MVLFIQGLHKARKYSKMKLTIFFVLKKIIKSLFLAFSVDHAWQISGVGGTKAAF